MGRVQQINQDSEFAPAITGAGSKLVVVDFFATWCGPCVRIAPFVDSLSTKYPNAVFLKVDVDKCKSVAQACGIRAMPTFQFFKNGAKIDDMTGADPAGLERKVQAHIGSGGSSFEGAGHVLGGASSSGQAGAAAATKSPVPGFVSGSGAGANAGGNGSLTSSMDRLVLFLFIGFVLYSLRSYAAYE